MQKVQTKPSGSFSKAAVTLSVGNTRSQIFKSVDDIELIYVLNDAIDAAVKQRPLGPHETFRMGPNKMDEMVLCRCSEEVGKMAYEPLGIFRSDQVFVYFQEGEMKKIDGRVFRIDVSSEDLITIKLSTRSNYFFAAVADYDEAGYARTAVTKTNRLKHALEALHLLAL